MESGGLTYFSVFVGTVAVAISDLDLFQSLGKTAIRSRSDMATATVPANILRKVC